MRTVRLNNYLFAPPFCCCLYIFGHCSSRKRWINYKHSKEQQELRDLEKFTWKNWKNPKVFILKNWRIRSQSQEHWSNAQSSSSYCSLPSWALKHSVKRTEITLLSIESFDRLFAASFQEQGIPHKNLVMMTWQQESGGNSICFEVNQPILWTSS